MVIHAVSTITRRRGTSKEDFDKYWSGSHAQTFMANSVAQKNLIKYSQHHFDSEQMGILAAEQGSLPDVGCDGMAHFWAPDLQRLLEIFKSEHYKRVVVPDEARFIERGKTTMVVGIDDNKWEDGKAGGHVKL